MGAEPLVSIVTSTYNSEKTVGRTIESVLGQTYSRIQYILADGASSDGTLQVAESYRALFEKRGFEYIILSSPDTGMYAGMNKGIAAAGGELGGIVNSDDFYEPKMAETAVRAYRKTGFDLFYADIHIVDEAGRKVQVKKSRRMKHYFTTRHWNHPTVFIPKRIYDIRRYDESFQYYGDWDLMLWIFKNYHNIVVLNRVLSNFTIGGKTTRRGMDMLWKKFLERRRAYRKNGYGFWYDAECFFMEFGKEAAVRVLGNGSAGRGICGRSRKKSAGRRHKRGNR